MTPELLLHKFGYLAVFVGTFLEGETILVMAGFFAERGYLHLLGVILTAFAGAFVGHVFWFWLGRTQGVKLLARMPRMNKHFGRGTPIFERAVPPPVDGLMGRVADEVDPVPLADLRHLAQVVRHRLDLAVELAEEGLGCRGSVEEEHARGLVRGALEAVGRASGDKKEVADVRDRVAAVDREAHGTFEDVIRFVPRVPVRRGALVLRSLALRHRPGPAGAVARDEKPDLCAHG